MHQKEKNRNNKISYRLLSQNEQRGAASGTSNERMKAKEMAKMYEVNPRFESFEVSNFYYFTGLVMRYTGSHTMKAVVLRYIFELNIRYFHKCRSAKIYCKNVDFIM